MGDGFWCVVKAILPREVGWGDFRVMKGVSGAGTPCHPDVTGVHKAGVPVLSFTPLSSATSTGDPHSPAEALQSTRQRDSGTLVYVLRTVTQAVWVSDSYIRLYTERRWYIQIYSVCGNKSPCWSILIKKRPLNIHSNISEISATCRCCRGYDHRPQSQTVCQSQVCLASALWPLASPLTPCLYFFFFK